MTPQERDLVTELFDRLAALENTPRDPEAERQIIDGLRHAPNATYALVQTTLVQDEALKRADARIRELEADLGIDEPPRDTSFLGGMKSALFGRTDAQRTTSVPSVKAGAAPLNTPSGYGLGATPGGYAGAPPPAPGGSFLGNAASTVAGVIGGSLLLDGIRSMMGHRGAGFGAFDQAHAAPSDNSPWTDSSTGHLAHDAGIDDIGRDDSSAKDSNAGGGGGFFGLFGGGNDDDNDNADDQDADDQDDSFEDDDNFDSGGLDDGGSDGGGDNA